MFYSKHTVTSDVLPKSLSCFPVQKSNDLEIKIHLLEMENDKIRSLVF